MTKALDLAAMKDLKFSVSFLEIQNICQRNIFTELVTYNKLDVHRLQKTSMQKQPVKC
jgi:hypothetical protein